MRRIARIFYRLGNLRKIIMRRLVISKNYLLNHLRTYAIFLIENMFDTKAVNLMETQKKQYVCIDLKSYYASVECVERGLDPLTTNLVVADESRTDKTICLAVSPSLKAYKISGRARLFEVKQRIAEIKNLTGEEIHFIIAPPRMQLYLDISAEIYSTYLNFVSPEDIHVYSIDEVFIDITHYLTLYGITAHELAMTMIRAVLEKTGITATAGIGTNMYLAKVAMDIVAKHIPADKNGVRIAELDEMSYREKLWGHEPLTDFWMVGHGINERLERYGIHTMGDLARFSLTGEDFLHREMGVDAEILIDHAWGIEPTEMKHIKGYKSSTESMGCGQVLKCAYNYERTRIVVREMAEDVIARLIDNGMVTDGIVLHIGYDGQAVTDGIYTGDVKINHYGKRVPTSAHGTAKLDYPTDSPSKIMEAAMALFDRIIDKRLSSRRLNLTAIRLLPKAEMSYQLGLFSDYQDEEKETELVKTTQGIKRRFGKNAVFKAYDLIDGATKLERNTQIGGHKA